MLPTDRDRFDATVSRYLAVWEKAPSASSLAMWWQALEELPLSDIQRGFEVCLKHSKFAPKPADIRRKVTGNESEGGTVAKDRHCSHPGCNQLWTIAIQGKQPVCMDHYERKFPEKNFLQANYTEAIGAVRALDKLGETKAREIYGDRMCNAVLANIQNDYYRDPPTKWTYNQETA